jgi:chorismate dehydratase
MSSFFYLQKMDELTLVPNISISCLGPVGSVLFFCKEEPDKLNGKIIQTSSSSATSVKVLSVLLAEQFGVRPRLIAAPEPDLTKPEVAGALLIGDQALTLGDKWAGNYLRIDLGQWWMQQFRYPMVFGVWAARNDWLQERPFDFDRIANALAEAKNLGLSSRFNEVIDEAGKRSGLARGELTVYYKRQLNFDFTDRHAAGLDLYRKLCEKHGLLKERPEQ